MHRTQAYTILEKLQKGKFVEATLDRFVCVVTVPLKGVIDSAIEFNFSLTEVRRLPLKENKKHVPKNPSRRMAG